MTEMLPLHGGDLPAAARRFGLAEDRWLDLSTGINPHAYPMPALPLDLWQRLPFPGEELALRAAAAAAYGAPDPDWVVAAPGTQALIQLLPRILPTLLPSSFRKEGEPVRVGVLSPTYAEHAASWAAAGCEMVAAQGLEDLFHCHIAIVVSPNNPTGRAWGAEELRPLRESLAVRGGFLLLDQAFADVLPPARQLVLTAEGEEGRGLIILRSFGKFYGLAGVRLGFALTAPALAARLRQALGPWAVSGPALLVGVAALSDRAWQEEMRARLAEQAEALDDVLRAAGLTLAGGTSLFRLALCEDGWQLWRQLAEQGILTRAFAYERRWLRLGLPPTAAGLDRLAVALAKVGAKVEA